MPLEVHPPIADEVPWLDHVTDYDRAHFILYVRLLDAEHLGADDSDMCRTILGLDPDCARARLALESHLKRARWMSETGYRDLLPAAKS